MIESRIISEFDSQRVARQRVHLQGPQQLVDQHQVLLLGDHLVSIHINLLEHDV